MRLVAGGGFGAVQRTSFLHGTHGFDAKVPIRLLAFSSLVPNGWRCRKRWPENQISRKDVVEVKCWGADRKKEGGEVYHYSRSVMRV